MTREEQETIIRFDNADSCMTVYTADPASLRRLKSLPAYECIQEDRQQGKVIAATFKASKKLLTLRGKLPVSHLTDEQRAASSERMREYHKQKRQSE